ncbi:hypothetical protein [Nocardioides stalactiti]|uniref:hypothetical protein n=1 Tax=Nocardioides stalactiti TaxID=2755356 RepID=UPI001601D2D2|nr:hypothetical protein [Nocardioides stalactiti]
MPGPHGDAHKALLMEITRQVEAIKSHDFGPIHEAELVRDLALAFRYTSGGPQPGTPVAPSSD